MRIQTRLKVAAAVTVLLAVGGCLDSSLDITNPNEQTLEDFWETESDAINATNSVYFIPYTRGMWGRNRYWVWGRTDVYMSRSPASNIQNAVRGIITNYNYSGFLAGLWDDPWVGVFRANKVLARVPEMDIDAGLQDRLVAETKFLRGLFYFQQALLFGDIPIITEPVDADAEPEFRPVAEVWAQVIQDASDAAAVLPWTWTGDDIGRATRGGALALMAEAHMHRGEWGQAATALQQIVDSEQYQLLADYGDLFRIPEGEQSAESLFEVAFGDQDATTAGVRGNINPRLVAPSSGLGSSIGFNDIQPTDWGFLRFFEGPGLSYPDNWDPRLDASIFWNRPGGMDVFGMPFADRYATTGPGGGPGFRDTDLDHTYFFKKYQEYWRDRLTNFFNPINWKVYRLGHVYMMLAEARVELNELPAAEAAIAVIRERAGVLPMPAGLTQTEMREWVNHEWVRESFWEGHHRLSFLLRHDLLRQDYLEPRNPFHGALFEYPKHLLIPIPQVEMDRNPNAVQNPGW